MSFSPKAARRETSRSESPLSWAPSVSSSHSAAQLSSAACALCFRKSIQTKLGCWA